MSIRSATLAFLLVFAIALGMGLPVHGQTIEAASNFCLQDNIGFAFDVAVEPAFTGVVSLDGTCFGCTGWILDGSYTRPTEILAMNYRNDSLACPTENQYNIIAMRTGNTFTGVYSSTCDPPGVNNPYIGMLKRGTCAALLREAPEETSSVRPYPQPAQHQLHWSGLPPRQRIELYDLYGRRYADMRVPSSGCLSSDLTDWPNGHYVFAVTDASGQQVHRGQIQVQH